MSYAYAMMTHNTAPEEFFPVVIKNLARDWQTAAVIEKTESDYLVHFDIYCIRLNCELCARAQKMGAYSLDRLVMRALVAAGFPTRRESYSHYLAYVLELGTKQPEQDRGPVEVGVPNHAHKLSEV